jgi:hypothetical protein
MPTALPVPSKGALRALRNLALGTSCTIAFGAGMITEDRRRRIRSAREIHDNAQKIKTSRGYYSAGRALIDTLDDQVIDDTIWLAGDPNLKKLTKETNQALEEQESRPETRTLPPPIPPITRYDPSDLAYSQSPKYELAPSPTTVGPTVGHPVQIWPYDWNAPKSMPEDPTPYPAETLDLPPAPPQAQLPEPTKLQVHNRQHRLASDVNKLLQDLDDLEDVEAAALRFFDAFEEGIPIGDEGIMPFLIDSAANLSEVCRKHSMLSYSEMVLDIVLAHPPVDEATFQRFAPLQVISSLISRKDTADHEPLSEYKLRKASSLYLLPESRLRKASLLYLMEFKEKPVAPSNPVLYYSIGERLCRKTCLAGLHDLTHSVYFRAQLGRKGLPPIAVDSLITATNAMGRHKRIFRYFKAFYSQTSPDKVELYNISDLVVDSVLNTSKMDQAEEVLFIANRMAEAGGFASSTTPILKVIGHTWRTTRDFSKIQELFKRIEPLIHAANHPQAAYGAVIQCCVEAGEETMAQSYYAEYRQRYTPVQADLRIYGHFALAKAMRNDWAGVTEDLQNMAALITPQNQGDYESSFIPILKRFAEAHSVNEVEEFVREFMDHHQLTLTDYLLNVMINVYAKAKEVNALVGWIEYATSVGCPIDAVSVNTIIHNCHQRWKFSFHEILVLYSKIRKVASDPTEKFSDQDTLEILSRIALADCPDAAEAGRRLKVLKELGRSKQLWDGPGVIRAMASTFERGEPAATLKIYRLALERGVLLNSRHILLAVRAALELHGSGFTEAVRLIKDAQQFRKDVSLPVAALLIHQLDQIEDQSEAGQILQFGETAVSALEENGVKISQAILNHTMSHLGKRGECSLAIEFWKSMCRRLKISTSAIDLETLTTLLKMYIRLENGEGIRWAVHMLSANGISPDKRFFLYVKGARKEVQKASESPRGYRISSGFMSSLLYATSRVVLMRKQETEEKERMKKLTVEIIERAIRGQERGNAIVLGRPSKRFGSLKYDEEKADNPWEDDDDELRAALRRSPPDMYEVTAS